MIPKHITNATHRLSPPEGWDNDTDGNCERCDGTGHIAVRNTYPMAYVGPGSPPDYATGVCGAKCDACQFPFSYRGEE